MTVYLRAVSCTVATGELNSEHEDLAAAVAFADLNKILTFDVTDAETGLHIYSQAPIEAIGRVVYKQGESVRWEPIPGRYRRSYTR